MCTQTAFAPQFAQYFLATACPSADLSLMSSLSLQMVGPSCGSDDHIEMAVPSPAGRVLSRIYRLGEKNKATSFLGGLGGMPPCKFFEMHIR